MPPGRSALISGASSGIGLAIARVLAQEGYSLTLTARRTDKLEKSCEQLRSEGYDVHAVAARIGDEGAENEVVRAHEERFGQLDILVNNVGLATQAALDEMLDRRIDLQLAVNLRSVISFYRAALPMLRESGRADGKALVINTSSASARDPRPGLSVYAATKAAVVSFTHAMNVEIGTEGIKSTALCPGYVATPMTDHIDDVAVEEMITPEDIGEVVRSLLRLSAACVVPEIKFTRPGGVNW